ncbi:hypothetical protein M409DRAFT_53202 [Zasmidium cellare ATCC 36951]|uniref:Uncharacterized protein n=1 Tax=Zasmidium cellare ATCC 36951 TaxID=1080233 RepID=A0A6A6CRT9_ZASCE|nr:uncharacterized protein M409DRAFT_53202 [Zasmidium cellare ATCC 36951]KAF2168542.1 hypothetical protein M409DRAFT_53202 [Zasmidium cellare ATCC 36951]
MYHASNTIIITTDHRIATKKVTMCSGSFFQEILLILSVALAFALGGAALLVRSLSSEWRRFVSIMAGLCALGTAVLIFSIMTRRWRSGLPPPPSSTSPPPSPPHNAFDGQEIELQPLPRVAIYPTPHNPSTIRSPRQLYDRMLTTVWREKNILARRASRTTALDTGSKLFQIGSIHSPPSRIGHKLRLPTNLPEPRPFDPSSKSALQHHFRCPSSPAASPDQETTMPSSPRQCPNPLNSFTCLGITLPLTTLATTILFIITIFGSSVPEATTSALIIATCSLAIFSWRSAAASGRDTYDPGRTEGELQVMPGAMMRTNKPSVSSPSHYRRSHNRPSHQNQQLNPQPMPQHIPRPRPTPSTRCLCTTYVGIILFVILLGAIGMTVPHVSDAGMLAIVFIALGLFVFSFKVLFRWIDAGGCEEDEEEGREGCWGRERRESDGGGSRRPGVGVGVPAPGRDGGADWVAVELQAMPRAVVR